MGLLGVRERLTSPGIRVSLVPHGARTNPRSQRQAAHLALTRLTFGVTMMIAQVR